MDPAAQRAIASLGGVASHQKQGEFPAKGHEWTKEQARAAGKLGGRASAAKRAAAKATQ